MLILHSLSSISTQLYPLKNPIYLGTFYASIRLFSSIPPGVGLAFIGSTFIISRLTLPFFTNPIEQYRNTPLVPLSVQALNLTFSIFLTRHMFIKLGHHLVKAQIYRLCILCTISLLITKIAISILYKFLGFNELEFITWN